MTAWRRILTPYDIVLGVVILAAGIFSLQLAATAGAAGAGTLLIEVDGRLASEVTFAATDPPRLITVQGLRGELTVELNGGRARMLPLSPEVCPEGICWNSGWTSHPAKAIVCLPNRTVVRIVRRDGSGPDGISR